jgi:eukaryotic-like serine/threonine-protein kinase
VALEDRYELIELIGSGGMAEVWRARDLRLARDVAVKLIPESLTADASRRRRVEREARALATVNHPGIVTVYDYGESATPGGGIRPFLAMELVDGPDLQRYLDNHGPLPFDQIRRVMSDVLSALERAHGLGVIHGDLKPSNVFIGSQGAKIGDFGVARILDEETGATTVAATPSYAAPEVLRGQRPSAACDVYSAACLAFHLVTGRPPYEGASSWEVANKHLEARVPHIRDLRPEAPRELDEAIRRGMDKSPRKRYGSPEAFAHDLPELGFEPTLPVSSHLEAGAVPTPTEAIGVRADLGRVALLGPLEPLWTRLESAFTRTRVVSLGTVVILTLIMLALVLSRSPGPVLLPDVRGQLVSDAVSTLDEREVVVSDVSFRPITSGEPGRVVDTIPRPGEAVEPGSEVHLIVGAAAEPPEPAPDDDKKKKKKDDNNDDDDDDERGRGRGRGRGGSDD